MGNKVNNCDYCCYKNVPGIDIENKNGVIFISNNQQELNKVPTLISNINSNILNSKNNPISHKTILKTTNEEKITAYSTAAISKTVSNKNLKQVNLIKIPETYYDKEMVITKELIDENICKIQRQFQHNLLLKNKKINENEDLQKKNNKISRTISQINNDESDCDNEENNDMKVSVEPFNIYLTDRYNSRAILINTHQISSESFYSKIDSIDISRETKGYFLYKKKNYSYKGNRDINRKKSGFGIIKWDDGSIIKSTFQNSKINGYGIFRDTQNENSIFYGYYIDNIPNGYGYYIKDNLKLESDSWDKNNINGIGMEIWEDDNFYQGEFLKSEKNGIGLYRWPDSTLCIGEWKDNKLNGYGLMKYSNDSIYVGEFKDNLMDGFGEFLWGDAEYYCGYYKEGNKDGFGIYIWNFDKVSCYIGFWENGKQHGVGIKIIDNVMKAGLYKDGRKVNKLNGTWEFKDYLKPEQMKFFKFLRQNNKNLIKYIQNLKKNEIFDENSFTV